MHAPVVRLLDLRADLGAEDGERMLAFDLPPELAERPDVSAEEYGRALGTGAGADRIPAGKYLFLQSRGDAGAADIAAEALELQREGLWRSLRLGRRLYLRVLEEEAGTVRQLIRETAGDGQR